jgi:hypothetical protein
LVYEFGDRRLSPSEGYAGVGYGVAPYNDFQERTTQRGGKKRDVMAKEDSEGLISDDSTGELYGDESEYDWGGDFVGD